MERIPDAVLDRYVSGVNLMPGSLRDQLGEAVTLLVFLRHFGCMFCRETIAELRQAAEAPGYPPVVFFFQGTPTEGRAFLRRYWPEARAIADPELFLYESFGVDRGSLLQMFGPRALAVDGKTATLTVDGARAASAEIAASEEGAASGDPLVIGERFSGRIDEVSIAR